MVHPDVSADSRANYGPANAVVCIWLARVGHNTRAVEVPVECPIGAAVEDAIRRYIVCEGVAPHQMQIIIPPDDDQTPAGTV